MSMLVEGGGNIREWVQGPGRGTQAVREQAGWLSEVRKLAGGGVSVGVRQEGGEPSSPSPTRSSSAFPGTLAVALGVKFPGKCFHVFYFQISPQQSGVSGGSVQ